MSAEDKRYNGWANYETWAVNLWIDSEEGSYRYWHEVSDEVLKEAQADDFFTREERAAITLAERLKDYHEEVACDLLDGAKASASIWADLLHSALSEVNWREIALSMLETAKERAEVVA